MAGCIYFVFKVKATRQIATVGNHTTRPQRRFFTTVKKGHEEDLALSDFATLYALLSL